MRQTRSRTGEVAPWVKVLAVKSDDQSLLAGPTGISIDVLGLGEYSYVSLIVGNVQGLAIPKTF